VVVGPAGPFDEGPWPGEGLSALLFNLKNYKSAKMWEFSNIELLTLFLAFH
jgi:hypothetical protein